MEAMDHRDSRSMDRDQGAGQGAGQGLGYVAPTLEIVSVSCGLAGVQAWRTAHTMDPVVP